MLAKWSAILGAWALPVVAVVWVAARSSSPAVVEAPALAAATATERELAAHLRHLQHETPRSDPACFERLARLTRELVAEREAARSGRLAAMGHAARLVP